MSLVFRFGHPAHFSLHSDVGTIANESRWRRWIAITATLVLALQTTAHGVEPRLVTRGYTNLALDSNGKLWGWGANDYGQLGRPVQSPRPMTIPSLKNVVDIASFGNNSLALDSSGRLWSFGENAFGQSGNGIPGVTPSPIAVLTQVKQFSLGEHALAIRQDGSLWAWGRNFDGELGLAAKNSDSVSKPLQIGQGYAAVAAGWGYSLALKSDGSLWAWGANDCGQLGVGQATGDGARIATPTQVAGAFQSISAGADHVLALDGKGQLYAFGCNDRGQLGDGSNSLRNTPVKVMEHVSTMVAGRKHSLALDKSGNLYAWGSNVYGEIAQGDSDSNNRPSLIGRGFSQIGGMGEHSLALKQDGTLWSWGRNHMTQTAVDSDSFRIANMSLVNPPGGNLPVGIAISRLAGGDAHSLMQLADGSVWAWGDNRLGQLGQGTLPEYTIPIELSTPGNKGYVDVATGYEHALGLQSDGSLWAWGGNLFGQLADGTRIDRHIPVKIAEGVQSMAAGSTESVMLKKDGSVWMWGDGIGYRNNVDAPKTIPKQVDGGFRQIAAGYIHFAGIKQDGSVWAWGSNGTCQLGDGKCEWSDVPVKATGGSDKPFSAIAAGHYHTVALSMNGELWGWGDNEDGQLGTGPALFKLPVKLGEGYRQISAGSAFTLALKANGELWGFGRLFNRNCVPATHCAAILLDNGPFSSLSAGHGHAVIQREEGNVLSLGSNFYGQLGDGGYQNRGVVGPVENATLDGYLDLTPNTPSIPSTGQTPVFLSARKAGTLAALNLSVDMSIAGAYGTAGTATGRFADTGLNVYVVAFVPGAAASWWSLQPRDSSAVPNWGQLSWPLAAYLNNAGAAGEKLITAHILSGANLANLKGATFYIGYGVDADEMLRAGRYRQFFTAEQ